MMSESRLVSESLIEASAPPAPPTPPPTPDPLSGVAVTSAAKYFSCSTLDDVACSEPTVEPGKMRRVHQFHKQWM